jgi:mannose-6-phosphate isomerase
MIPPDQLAAPLRFAPRHQPRVWGGDRLARHFGRAPEPAGPIGESWELYHRPRESSRVAGGPLAGRTLAELLAAHPAAILGEGAAAAAGEPFPLVVKWLDATARLSLQVHPGGELARRAAGERAKNEAWYVAAAEPGAWVVRGLPGCAGPDDLRRAAAGGRLEELIRPFPVAAGDLVWLPAGTVHAMGGGLLVYEVQSNADLTWRIHDWDRLGLDGRPRELHLERALEAVDYGVKNEKAHPGGEIGPGRWLLVECADFRLERVDAARRVDLDGEGRFLVVTVCSGRVELAGGTVLGPGGTALVPAAAGPVAAAPLAGKCRLLLAGPGRRGRGAG